VAQADAARAVVGIEPKMPPVVASAEVGGTPNVAANAGGGAADEVGRWGRGGTLSGTWEEHCQTELPRPSSSLHPCVHRLHHP
jgi:hypothetical protein